MSTPTKRIALFKVETSFNITDRGIIAVGTFIEGTVKLGAKGNVVVSEKSTPVTVTGIEWSGNPDQDVMKCGLLLHFDDEECKQVVAQNRLQQQEIVLEYPLT